MTEAIQVEGLTKVFTTGKGRSPLRAVDGIDFTVHEGEVFDSSGTNWLILVLALLLSATAFSALGVFVSVAVKEVFEAQTLANSIHFPMMFLGELFVPVDSLPAWLQVIARFLPLTYSVEALRASLSGGSWATAALDLGALAAFSVGLFLLAVYTLARHND